MDPLVRNLLACALMTAGSLILLGYTAAVLAGWQPPLWLLWIGLGIGGVGFCFWIPSALRKRGEPSAPSVS